MRMGDVRQIEEIFTQLAGLGLRCELLDFGFRRLAADERAVDFFLRKYLLRLYPAAQLLLATPGATVLERRRMRGRLAAALAAALAVASPRVTAGWADPSRACTVHLRLVALGVAGVLGASLGIVSSAVALPTALCCVVSLAVPRCVSGASVVQLSSSLGVLF